MASISSDKLHDIKSFTNGIWDAIDIVHKELKNIHHSYNQIRNCMESIRELKDCIEDHLNIVGPYEEDEDKA